MTCRMKVVTAAATLAFLGALVGQALAGMGGMWLRPKTGAHIRSFGCRGGLGLKVITSKDRKAVGKVIMCGARSQGANKWKGDLYSTEDGNTYTGIVTLMGRKLKLQGCVLGGLICKTEYWKRLN